MLPKGRHITSY